MDQRWLQQPAAHLQRHGHAAEANRDIPVRDQPGWITFSIDGRRAYPSTGEVIDIKSKKILTTLEDEVGRHVQSEKLLEIVFANGKPFRAGDQFAMGTKR